MDKVYTSVECQTDISAVLTVTSGLDSHKIIEPEDDSKLMLLLMVVTNVYLIYLLWVNGINLYLVNAC